MSVDILAIGENNRKKLQAQQNQSNIINPWRQTPGDVEPISPKTKAQQTLDKQVEIGLGTRLDNVMTNKDKQLYADGLDEGQWNLMQRYKAEGYSFEASKAMVEQNKELLDPYAQGINKFKDYQAKEQYYNNTGGTVDPNSNLYKIGTFLQKIGFDDQYGNPLNKLATQYNEWYMNEREAMDYLKDNGELNLLERFGWWLERGLLSAESGIISGLGKIGNAVQGVEDIKSSAMDAALDRAILGYDTDLNFYRETDRRLDEYALEGISGGLNTIFRAMAPKMMTAFSYIGETEKGGKALTTVDDFIKGVNKRALENITEDYWNSLDEQGKEDLLDTMTTLEYMYGAKKVNNRTAKLKTTKIGSQYETLKAQNRAALERGFKEAKNQAKAEVKNVKNATEVINGDTGKVTGKIGPEGQVGVAKSVSRIVNSGVQGYKQYFIDRLNARHSGGINTPGTVPETGVTGAKPTEVPTGEKGVIGKTKDLAKQTWDNTITGLTPEERIRIQNDPYVADKFNKALAMINEAGMPLEDAFITEQLYNEIGDKIKAVFDERENKLGDTSPYYREIRNNPTQYNLVQALPEISTVLTANDIVRDPISGELDFTNSKFVSDADMRSVQRALNMIEKAITKPLTPREYLNLRDKLKQLASYATVDASRGQSLIRQLRHTVNEVAHKTIPGLKDLDKVTSKYFNEIAELKDGWVYKGGDRKGEVRNNFYSIIKNLTGQNRKVMLDRLEKYYPGVGEEIEAIHIVNKMVKAYNKSPQMIKSMGIGGAFGGVSGGLVGGGIVGALLGAIAGEMVNKGLIEPRTKKRRKLAIEKLISQLSPEAQRKLEAIAVRQMTAKEISAEDQAVLDKVAEIIMKERERGLSESALREWEQRTKGSNNPALPGVAPDVISPEGNITLGRGNPITPQQGPGRSRRLTKINEINLRNPEVTPDKQALDLQEKLAVDTETALDIQNRMNEFLTDIGADEMGTVGGREVNYSKFSTRSLEELMENENIPRTEKAKIQELLVKRGAETEMKTISELDKEYAYRINKLMEQEQRIGKVGKNKVGKEYADKQMREWEKKKERLLEKMMEDYNIDQEQALDKYAELEAKPIDYINSYKRSDSYKTESAEREILDSLMTEWGKQPKFVRDMNESLLQIRQDLLNNVELSNGYKLETTDYNDRYILEDNGQIVDRGAIKYNEDGTIEITAQSIDGLKSSGLLNYLPDDTMIKVAGEELWATLGDLRYGDSTMPNYAQGERRYKLEDVTEETGVFEPYHYTKLSREITPKQKEQGLEIYRTATDPNAPYYKRDEARKIFVIQTLQKGYIESLGLNPGEVNKQIESWGKNNLSERENQMHETWDRQDQWIGADLIAQNVDRVINKSALESFVGSVEGTRSGTKDIERVIKTVLAIDSNQDYSLAKYIFMDLGDPRLGTEGGPVKGLYFGDTDEMFMARKLPYTPAHETGHYIDYLRGREITGKAGPITNVSADLRGASTEAKQFFKGFNQFIDELEAKIPDMLLNDESGPNKGIAGSYWSKRTEVMARLTSAFVDWVERSVNGGPLKEIKGEHEDIFSDKDMENYVYYLQWHSKLKNAGELYDAQDIDIGNAGSHKQAVADYIQKSVFEENKSTGLEKYFREKPYNIDIMYKTYDPDILEWMNNIKKRFVGGEDITLNELYEVKNMMEQHSKEKGTQIDVPDGPTAQLLLEKAESMAKDKISTYDKKQIKKITGELSDLIQGYSDESIEIRGATYNPDVDVRQKKIDKIRLARKQYMANTDISLPHTSRLTSLKAKIEELSKYSVEDINNAIGMTDLQVKHFMEEIKPRIEELQAKGIEKAVTNLVALHNLDIVNFAPLIQDFQGKDPMPSIAVMDPNVPHEVFGDISLVFGRDTIDPKVDPANKIYGSDAWTPTFPKIKRSTEHIESFANSLINDLFVDNGEVTRTDIVNISNTLHDALVDAKEVSKFKDMDPSEKWNYIKETLMGRNDRFKELITKYPGIDELMFDKVTGFIEDGGLEERKIIPARYFDTKPTYRNADQIAEELVEYVPEEVRKYYDEGESGTNMLIKDIKRTLQKWIGGGTANIVDALGDEYAMDVEDPKIGEIVDRLQYLEEGDRPLTPENVLEAMKNQRNNRETYPGTFEDMIEIEGTELNDVEDVRKQNFAKVFHGDRTGDLGDLKDRYYYILDTLSREYVPYDEKEATIPLVERVIKKAYDTDVNKFQKNMMGAYSFTEEIPNELLQRIIDVVEQGKKIPIRFSESKPERIVNLMEEVQYILVPEGKKANAVRKIVKDTPLESKVVEYTPDNFTAPRSRKLKSLQKRYGNVFFSMGGVTMPIAMLYLMMKQEETA